jgi:hypothetical protein
MSIISAHKLVVSDSVFAFTSGTAPMAGIDFEPNSGETQITGVEIHSTRLLRNAGCGLQFAFRFPVPCECNRLPDVDTAPDVDLSKQVVS